MANRAFSLGGVGCCCGGCQTTICPQFCGKNMAGVLVEVLSGTTPVASCFSDATGCCTLDIGTAGTYNVRISITGFTTRTQSRALTCGGSIGIQFTAAPTLSLTDSDRTITVTETSAGSRHWKGCYVLATGGTSDLTSQGQPAGFCDIPLASAGGNCDVLYDLDCQVTGGAGVWTLVRQWGVCCQSPSGPNVYGSSGALNVTTCTGNGNSVQDTGTNSQAILGFPFSITMTNCCAGAGPCGGSNLISSPLGAGVTVDV